MPTLPIGHRIRTRRKEVGLTQTALAKQLGISVSYVNLIEHDKRSIGGQLLNRLAGALGMETGALSGTLERRMLQDLEQVVAEPTLARIDLDADTARDLVARHEPWARALVEMRRAHQSDQRLIEALSNRLNHDPVLNESVHEMLSAAAAIRSVADIYVETPDLEAEQRTRFDAILLEEAKRLSTVAHSLVGVLEASEASLSGASSSDEVDDFLVANGNYFPSLEGFADGLGADDNADEHSLAERLRGERTEIVDGATGNAPIFGNRLSDFDRERRRLHLASGLAPATRRFELARALVELLGSDRIDEMVAAAPELTSDEGRSRARRALIAYAAAARVMPYTPFHAACEALRYDIDALAIRFSVSAEQLCHRFTTLRRPDAEGVPFAMLRSNAAGFLTKRFPLPRLPIPRYGGACPLWAVYQAMQTPDLRVRQLVEFPNGDRYFFVARASRPPPVAHGRSRPAFSLMLACDILHADRLVYADGIDLGGTAQAEPVGSACVLCPREDCAHRQEAPVRG